MKRSQARTIVLALWLGAVSVFGGLQPAESATWHVGVYGIQGDDSRDHAQGEPFEQTNPVCADSASCAYSPDPVTLTAGDSVEFENVGKLNHTATGDLNFSPRLPEIIQPTTSSDNFSTGKLKRGEARTIGPFRLSGSLGYYCLIHGPGQMRGALSVSAGATITTTTTTTTTTGAMTTTSTIPPVSHDVVVRFAPTQPPFVIGKIVQITAVVTNVGSADEVVHVTLSGDINYSAAQDVAVASGNSANAVFEYPVPVRLQVTLTAGGALGAGISDATPGNNSETKTFTTTTGAVAHAFDVRVTDGSPWFTPTRMGVTVGDTVRWTNFSAGTHTVTSLLMTGLGSTGTLAASSDQAVILGGDFDRRDFEPGMTFSVTFNEPGAYPYLCFIHPYMAGVISVGLPGVLPPAGPVPDILIGHDTLDGGLPSLNGRPAGIGEFCVTAEFELSPGAGVSGVVHCGDAATFQDLPLTAFDAGCLPGTVGCNPTASVRVMGQADGAASLAGRRIGGRWEGINHAHDLWFDRTGTKMFVTQSHGDSFLTIDRMTNTIVDTTVVFAAADVTHVMTDPSGSVGFLTLEGGLSGQIGLFDPNHPDHPMTGFIPLTPEHHPHGFWVCGDGRIMVTALPMSNHVGFVNLPSTPTGVGSVRTVTPAVGLYPVAVGALQDCSKAYTSNALSNSVGVNDPVSGAWLHNVDLPFCSTCTMMGVPFPATSVPMHLPPSPDGRFVVVNMSKASSAAVIDTTSDLVVSLVDCGSGCHGSSYGPKKGGGFYWWGTATYQDKVTVIDMDTLTKAGDVPLNVRSVLTLQGLTPLGCPSCTATAPGKGGGMGMITFPLSPPWVQPVVVR